MRIALVYADHLDSEAMQPVLAQRIDCLERAMNAHSHEVTRIVRCDLPDSLDAFDLVAAAGGDGTQLDAACRMTNTPLCAIRLFPEQSVGFHCTLDFDQFENAMAQLAPGAMKIVEVPRLQCFIDGSPVQTPVLNDILLANACPARASRYMMHFHNKHTRQCSSGIWFATQPGSHGASKSAGAPVLDENESHKAVFIVRELMACDAMKSAVFEPGVDELSVEVTGNGMHLYFDGGLSIVPIKPGQILSFGRHPYPLRKWII